MHVVSSTVGKINTSFKAYYLAYSVTTKSHVLYVMSAYLVTRILQQEWTKYD